MKSYRELEVWRRSYAWALAVYRASQRFPRSETYGLCSQMQRAAVSIPTNIAEGYCRRTRGDYLRFISITQGSVGELDTLLSIAYDLSYLDEAGLRELAEPLAATGQMLTRLVQSLQPSDAPCGTEA